jgi:hypothetical protein
VFCVLAASGGVVLFEFFIGVFCTCCVLTTPVGGLEAQVGGEFFLLFFIGVFCTSGVLLISQQPPRYEMCRI